VSAFTIAGCDGCDGSTNKNKNEPNFVDVPTAGKSLNELIKDGHTSLAAGKYDEAIAYYEAAYKNNDNDSRAIAYSALARLAGISVDPKVVNLFKNRIGFSNYPNRLNALLSGNWLTTYNQYWNVWSYRNEEGSWVYYFDQWDINNGYYKDMGVDRPGYYTESYNCDDNYDCNWAYTLVRAGEQIKERAFQEGYYDESGRYARWYDEWYVQSSAYPGVNRVGYHRQTCGSSNTGFSCNYTFVSSEKRFYNATLPGLADVNWVKGSNSVYNSTLFNNAPTVDTWAILLYANLLDKNTNGLNNFLDEAIDAVFGASFKEVCSRIDKLEGKPLFTLDKEFLEAVNLENVIDEHDMVGWPELNALVSFMTAIKGSLEWIAAYDWNTNLNFLKFAWTNDEADFYNKLRGVNARDLPFNNNFLKARSGKMDASKASFIKAVEGLQASYTAIQSSSIYPSVLKGETYKVINEGAGQLASAIRNGGVFYVPIDDFSYSNPAGVAVPSRPNDENQLFKTANNPLNISSWPTSGNGINMGKLFQPGYFSLQNLFETEDGKPVFYADGVKLTASNYAQRIDNAGRAGIKFKGGHVGDILVPKNNDFNEPVLNFPARYAKLLFEKYNGLPLSQPALSKRSELPDALAKTRLGE